MKANEQIKAWLKAEGRSKGWLARQVAVTPTTLSRWLGCKAIPTPQARILLSQIIGQDVTATDLWQKQNCGR